MARLFDMISGANESLNLFESEEIRDIYVKKLELLAEMVKNGEFSKSEMKDLLEAVQYIFEEEDGVCPECGESYEDCECEYEEGEPCCEPDEDGNCTCDEDDEEVNELFYCLDEECGWEGSVDDLDDEGMCPECGGDVEEDEPCCEPDEDGNCTCDDEELEEALLNKTTSSQRRASLKFSHSANGIKAQKKAALKRRKFAKKFRNAPKGMTYSLKKGGYVKTKHQR